MVVHHFPINYIKLNHTSLIVSKTACCTKLVHNIPWYNFFDTVTINYAS